MKVLHVIPSLAPTRGGPSFALYLMTAGLAREGVTAHVATTDDNGRGRLDVPPDQPVLRDGLTTWYFPRQTRFYTFSWPLTRWLARRIRDYDLVHIHALFSYASAPAAFYAWRHGIPYIVRPLGTLNRWGMENRRRRLKQASFRLIERHILAGAAAVHFTSEKERMEAAELGVEGNAAVIPLGVDVSQFHELPSPSRFLQDHPSLTGHTVILYLSRLDRKKGLEVLLPAFAKVRMSISHAALVVAGSGEDSFIEELQATARRLNIQDGLVWTGFLGGEDKLAALAAADIFVLPSHSENFSVATVEAMAARLPVILSEQVGISSEVERAQAGLVVRSEVEALSTALQLLLSDPELRHRMGDNARQLACARFSTQITTRQLIELYEQTACGQRAAVGH